MLRKSNVRERNFASWLTFFKTCFSFILIAFSEAIKNLVCKCISNYKTNWKTWPIYCSYNNQHNSRLTHLSILYLFFMWWQMCPVLSLCQLFNVPYQAHIGIPFQWLATLALISWQIYRKLLKNVYSGRKSFGLIGPCLSFDASSNWAVSDFIFLIFFWLPRLSLYWPTTTTVVSFITGIR